MEKHTTLSVTLRVDSRDLKCLIFVLFNISLMTASYLFVKRSNKTSNKSLSSIRSFFFSFHLLNLTGFLARALTSLFRLSVTSELHDSTLTVKSIIVNEENLESQDMLRPNPGLQVLGGS